MRKRTWLILGVLSIVLSGCYIPGGKDYDNASSVGNFISTKYGQFVNRRVADRVHKGKIYYVLPGRYPTIQFYEITEPDDIANVEKIAKESLDSTGVAKIKLVFLEKQNWHGEPDKAGFRGHEKIIKEIIVEK